MIEIDKLEALAKSVGGDEWTPTHATTIGLATVWLPDGDSVCKCHGNIGHWPDAIDADDVAEYIAAVSPAPILTLIAEVRALRENRDGPGTPSARLSYLHGQLNARFPDAVDVFSSEPPEPKFIAAVDAMIAEVRALRGDAGRYQWLKAHWGHRTPILNGLFPRGVVDDAFDAGIDMAIAKEKA